LVAAAGAAFFALRPASGARDPQRIAPIAAAEIAPQADPMPAPGAAVVPTPPPAAPAKVLIEVQTEPPGADVIIEGRSVCSPTPCTFSAEHDALLKVQAELTGHRPGTTELRADDAHKLVKLALKKRSSAPRNEPAEGELLIPDAFARPRRR
jgi:hypothetical protein